MLSQSCNHEPEDDEETSTNEGSSKYLHSANQGMKKSIMQTKETVKEYEHERNEVRNREIDNANQRDGERIRTRKE